MNAEARLIVLSGPLKGKEVPLQETVTIGRNPENTLQLEDLQISRTHARILQTEDGLLLEDLKSGNGTYVGAQRIFTHRLQDGDVIRIGRQQLQYRVPHVTPNATASVGGKHNSQAHLVVESKSETTNFEAKKAEHLYKTFFEASSASGSEEDLRNIQQRLQAVYNANQSIASERTLDKVFDKIMEQIFSLLVAHNGLIMLKQERGAELSVEFVRSEQPGLEIHVSSSIISRAYENGEAIITNNAAEDSRFGVGLSIIAENITSAMCVPLIHQDEALGVIYVDNHGTTNAFTNNDLELLVALAAPAATAIKNAKYLEMIEQAYQDTLVALANAIELRDHYTVGHTWRVTNFSVETARELGWDQKKLQEVHMGGVLHDVGKIAVDNAILSKPEQLTEDEFAQMKVHPERGADLLRDITYLHPLIPYCLYHHERWDGKGYPFSLQEEAIPIEGRLVAVADAFDAMTSTRPYRKGLDPDVAIQRLIDGKSRQFDPLMVDALVRCYQKGSIARILQDYYKNEARSIACPFCSTFIRLDETVGEGSELTCEVCHKNIRITEKDDAFFGVLAPLSGVEPATTTDS